MSVDHKSTIDANKDDLLDVLHVGEILLTELCGEGVLGLRTKQEIMAGGIQHEINGRFLDWLKQSQPSTFTVCLEKLRFDQQNHIANLLDGTPGERPLTKEKRLQIQKNIRHLSEMIDVDSGLLLLLYSKGVISTTEQQELNSEIAKAVKALKLLQVMLQKSDRALNCFVDALRATNQAHVISTLEKGNIIAFHAEFRSASDFLDQFEEELVNFLEPIAQQLPYLDNEEEPVEEVQLIKQKLQEICRKGTELLSLKKGKSIIIYLWCEGVEAMAELFLTFETRHLEHILEEIFNLVKTSVSISNVKIRVTLAANDLQILKEAVQLNEFVQNKPQLAEKDSTPEFIDDFNQGILLPSLILQLRSILERYPDDGQILKEIIQNAEDAGASKVIFLIDNTTYGTDVSKLHHEALAKYQGPALYAYNDSVFRYSDWTGIRMLDSSVKADDPLKIGRFGLGFKSVFHMTDLPSIFSSKGIGFIDPHKECFEYQPPGCRTKENTTAFFYHLDKDHDRIARLEDQFEPFMQPLFGVTPETFQSNYFNGTMFRFPFRTLEMMSDLSKTTYDRQKVLQLVHSLKANAHHMLLFLRNLQCVEVYEKTHDGKTSKLLEIKIEESYLKLIKEKLSEFQGKINVDWRGQPPVSVTYPIAMNVEIWDAATSVKKTNVWLVSQYYAGAEESPAVTLSSDKVHLPLVGVALPIEASSVLLCDADPGGHVFCFLPLPLERKSPTGLRFHVHGNFAIEQNRRHIKWPSADRDTTRLTDDALLWNNFLVNVVLPKAAILTMAYLTQLRLTADNIPAHFLDVLKEGLQQDAEFVARLDYAVFPNVALVTPQWKGFTEAFYRTVWIQAFFHTLLGKWIVHSDAIFECIDAQDPMSNLIRLILCEDNRNLVSIPRYIKDQLPRDARYVTPDIVRDSLRNIQYRMDLKDEERRILLEYLLEFSKDTDYQNALVGLVLLPLENGTWTEFEMARSVKKVYVASKEHPLSLLPGLEGRFLKSGIASKAIRQLIQRRVTQLKYLDSNDFREMIGDVFSKWQTKETVALESESWFTRSWLASLWKYLQDHFRTELHLFEGLHILPLGNGYVVKLSKQLPLVSRIDNSDEDGETLSEEIAELCNHVGVIVVKDMELEVLRHSSVWNTYVLCPNARGLLTALQRLEKQTGKEELVKLFKDVADKAKQYFRNFIGFWKPLTTDDVNLLKTLPIFSTVNGSGGQVVTFVSVVEGIRVAPLGDNVPLPCPEILLDTSDEISYILAKTLGVNAPNIPDHIIDVYFPAVFRNYYNQNELIKLMQYVCHNLLIFEKINRNIVPKVKEINFVPRQNGNLMRPSDVYEKDELLGKLFVGEDVFPVGEFAKDEFKAALQRLGLKTAEAVTPQEVLAVAEKLSGLPHPNRTELEQAEALMKFLNQHGHRVLPCIISEDKSLQQKLTDIKWVQISSVRPPSYPSKLQFVAENLGNNFVRPNEVFTHEHVYLVGSVRYIIAASTFPFLAKCFNWSTQPQIRDVSCHLLSTIAIYDATQKAEVLCILNHVYKYFNELGNELQSVLCDLQDRSWVWQGDGFVRTSQMVLNDNHGVDLRPYVYILPKESTHFHQLWNACNIREQCNHIEVLRAIKKAHDENDIALKNKEHDLKLAINILNELATDPLTDELRQEIVVPINTENDLLEMKSIDECTYRDKESYHEGFDVEDCVDKMFLIHELIPLTTAENLNIPSLISKTIGAEELDMQFGQTEPLTRRLHGLLWDYTDGLAVLKELIQNADDAGASEIRFLYDERSNQDARQSLLDQGMKDLQGPALWTYNDAVFTDDDFESITKLSGATKDSVTEKIGRFGLGFNAVYNLTDVPMFISRQFIVIFDPHTTYLGRALTNKGRPGIRLNLDRHRNKIRRLTDQFKPMNGIFGCDLGSDSTMKLYNGTLFRFPLRTFEQATKSKISQVCYNREEIFKLLKLLYDGDQSLLLYTQNVRKITVCHLPEMGSPPVGIEEWFSIQKNLVKVIRNITCRPTSATTTTIEAQCAVLKQATAILNDYRTNPERATRILDSSSVLKFTVCRGIELPKNFQRNPSSDSSEWLVVSSLGTGSSLRMALDSEKRNMVPVGGVAARLERTSDGNYKAVSADGMLFCFLPLPIKTCFPVHINGFFDVHSSRIHLCERSPQDKNVDSRALWNEALLDDAVTRAYCVLLEDLATLSPEVDSYALWPVNRKSGLVGHLTELLYRSICSTWTEMNVVKTLNGWTTVLKSKMLSKEFRSLEIGNVALLAFEIILKYSRNDEHVVDIPDNITQTILQTNSADVIKERIVSKVDFYKIWFLPNIGIIEPLQRDQLILYALSDREITRHLKGINCIPVSPGGFPLKSIEELIHPESEIAVLFDAEEGRFPRWTSGVIIDSHVYKRLVDLGMRKDDLPWQEILVRCKLISLNPGTAATRTPIILALLEKKLGMNLCDSKAFDAVFDQIQDVKFLPVMKKPEDFPLKWKGDDYLNYRLISCKEGYLETYQRLVCCSYPIIDETFFAGKSCSSTKRKLGLENKLIVPEVVIQQVLEVIAIAEKTDGTVLRLSPESLNILSEVYNECFRLLNIWLENGILNQSDVKPLVSRKSIKLRSNYYLSPDRCATRFKHGNDDLLPYMAVVPPDISASFPCLLKMIGVKEAFSLSDYVRVLKEISEQFGNNCLDEAKLSVVLHLVTMCVYEEIKSCPVNMNRNLLSEMPIPNAEGRMCPAKDLCFNNCLWLTSETQRSKFCHDRIAHEIASTLGLRTMREDILKRHRIARPFGQRERLVNRIKTILSSYPFSEDILKEMLQNADDAGAKEIHFILDTRTLSDEKVFEDSWKPLQGPALCIYNDRSFSPSDLEGIQRLGEGGKSNDPTTTGQYGVGFNCVYHLTDVPTFLTTVENEGTLLCVLDPNCTFVPGATSVDPGAMYTVDQTLKEQFSDVFKGYSFAHKQYDVSQSGTLFRLPLRNPATAKDSEISKKLVTVKDVDALFEKFETDLSESLLFVNSIEKIQLVKVTAGKGNSDRRSVFYEVNVQMTEDARRKRAEFSKYVKDCAKKLRSREMSIKEIEVKEISYQMEIKDSRGNEDVWQIVQRFGFEKGSVVPDNVVHAVHYGILGLLPRGGVAFLVQTTKTTVKRQSRLFCFLPLPVPVHLPVHLNGHFALDRNRRNLWKDEHEDYRTEWNTCLMEGVVAPAYCTVLCAERDRMKQLHSYEPPSLHLERYFEAFPQLISSDGSYVNRMASCVYRCIISKDLDVLPLQSNVTTLSEIEWNHPRGDYGRKIYFDVLDQISSEVPGDTILRSLQTIPHLETKRETVRVLLVRCGFSLFWCPAHVREYLVTIGKYDGVLVVNPTAVLDFFGTYSCPDTRCKVMNLPEKINNTPYQNIESLVAVLEYCTEIPGCKERLEGMPFLVTVDNVVSQFDRRMVKYVSMHSGVAPHIPGQFMNLNIKRALNLETNFDVTLCKEFTVEEFALTLRGLVTKPEFYDGESWIQISELDDILKPYNKNGLHWLREAWSFLSSFLQARSCWSENQPKSFLSSFLKGKPYCSENQDKKVVEKLLKPLMKCCLLPVLTLRGETLLYPLCLSSGVIAEPSTTESCNEVAALLYALGVAKPNYSYIYDEMHCSEIERLLKYSLGSVQQPATVVEALRIAMRHKLAEFKVTNDEGLQLLEYLAMHIKSWKDEPHATVTIAKLPFFLTFWDTQTSLDNSTTYVFPSEIPSSGIESLIAGQEIQLLKNIGNLRPLLRHLGCTYLNTEEIYCSFIFKCFQNLPLEAELVHLDFVKQHVFSLKYGRNAELNRFLECLTSLAFIRNRSNELSPASEFYDPQNEIFQVMHEEDRFPPDPYNKEEWLPFLRMCGLVDEVTKEKFLSYAQQLERNSQSGINSKSVKQSETLVRHFLSRKDHRQMDLELVKNIRFVSPGIASKSLQKLHLQHGTVDGNKILRFISFSGATLHENEELVWTMQNLLPPWILRRKYSSDVFSCLEVSVSVQSTAVAQHLEKLCSRLEIELLVSDMEKINTLKRVLETAFAFFKKKLVLDDSVKSILSRTRCVFVTDPFDLVTPSQVAIDITTKDEIRPYLYKIPMDLGSYTSVLLPLGSTKALTTNQYAFALKKIADASEGKKMHPEEKKASCKATEGFLRLIKGGQAFDGDIFLPCTDQKLHKSSEVIFDDRKDLLQRLSKFDCPILIDSEDLNMRSRDLEKSLNKMPISQRPRFLSQIVHEVLADGQTIKCEFAEKTAARLRNPEFRSGFERIVRHCLVNETRSQVNWNEENLKHKCKQLTDMLDNIVFIGRYALKTYLQIDGRKLDESEQNFKSRQEKTLNGDVAYWKFYISIDAYEDDEGRQLYREIADVLNNIVEQRINDRCLLALIAILDCPIFQIRGVLNNNKIMESEPSRSFVPPLGCSVPQEYLHMLIQDKFSFYPSQLVALEKDDPFDRGEEGEPVFILVQIVERLESDAFAKYKIRVNDTDERIVHATLLYAFSRGANIEVSDGRQLVIRVVQDQASTPKPKPRGSPKTDDSSRPNDSSKPTDSQRPSEPPKVSTLKEAVEEIKKVLIEAWKGTPEERKRVKKRLYLRWHPDKNPDQVELSTEVCKILQHLIKLLESGKSIDDYGASDEKPTPSRSDSGFESGFGESYRGSGFEDSYRGSGFDDFYSRAGQRARYFNQRRDRCSGNSSGRQSGGFHSSRQENENFFTGFRSNRNPQPGEARRWMLQARHDLGAVENDRNAFDWKCLKCFEAAKLALMAVQYATDSNSIPSNLDRIDSILNNIGDVELRSLSLDLERLVIGLSHMKYPSSHDPPRIPGDVYRENHANEAYRLSKQILDRCDQIIERP